jgi:hypothetical protein
MFLLDNGANHTCVNVYGESVANIVDRKGYRELAQAIREYRYEPVPTKGMHCDDYDNI